MTDPVILLGTQSNGETLPVQVDDFGRLVAEGLQGLEGPQGPEGPAGGAFPLPADPYEGALLGWLNGGLAWVGTPPVPIPDYLFGPIVAIENGVITVEGDIPSNVQNGVFVWQTDAAGNLYSEGCVVTKAWQDILTGNYDISNGIDGFNGTLNGYVECFNGVFNEVPPKGFYGMELNFASAPLNGPVAINSGMTNVGPYDGRFYVDKGSGYGSPIGCSQNQWTELDSGNEKVYGIRVRSSQNGCSFKAIRSGGKILLDPTLSANARVQSVTGNLLITSMNDQALFQVGSYLRTFDQRVAPWVLYGNDPTSLIDHLRSK